MTVLKTSITACIELAEIKKSDIMDKHYLMPNGAFYATQRACAPLHLAYDYGDHSVHLINDHFYNISKHNPHCLFFGVKQKKSVVLPTEIFNNDFSKNQKVIAL